MGEFKKWTYYRCKGVQSNTCATPNYRQLSQDSENHCKQIRHIMSESKPSSKEKIDFDELLNHIGGWGKFQITLLVMMIQFTFFLAYVGYSPILYLYVPDHWCSIPLDIQDKVSFSNMTDLLDVLIPYDENIQKRSQCYMYNISGIDNPNDLLNNSMVVPLTKCTNGWTY